MNLSSQQEAISNNAAWCNAMAVSHGVSAHWKDTAWYSISSMPPLYPNLVTLRKGIATDQLIEAIDSKLPQGWAMKDSFAEFELEGKGFTLAFSAHWFCREAGKSIDNENYPALNIKTVDAQSKLHKWIAAWGEKRGIFNSSLLQNDTVDFLYAEHQGKIVSGFVINTSGSVIGISNEFGNPRDLLGCIRALCNLYPTKRIVGYASKAQVTTLACLGFEEIGALRVWLRS